MSTWAVQCARWQRGTSPSCSFTAGQEATASRWLPALWNYWCLTVPAWTTTAIVHGLTGLFYTRPAAFFLPEMWYTDQITFHCLPWSQSSAFSRSISQREAWLIVWRGRCQHREMCFCLSTEPYTGFLIYFQKVSRWSRYGKTDENFISLAAGEQEEEDRLMCFREEDAPGGMLMGSHLPYFYLSCWMLSFTGLPKFSFTKIGASEHSGFSKSVCIWGA